MVYAAVAAAIIGLVAVAGIPAGWYSKSPATAALPDAAPITVEAQASNEPADSAQPEQPVVDPNSAEGTPSVEDANTLAAKRLREARERARYNEAAAAKQAAVNPQTGLPVDAAKKPGAAKAGAKMVTVQVAYDEAGRVTQTSGGDGTAQRIARQKRFPAGKAGTSTVTIPIN